jgi:hypothetical protein
MTSLDNETPATILVKAGSIFKYTLPSKPKSMDEQVYNKYMGEYKTKMEQLEKKYTDLYEELYSEPLTCKEATGSGLLETLINDTKTDVITLDVDSTSLKLAVQFLRYHNGNYTDIKLLSKPVTPGINIYDLFKNRWYADFIQQVYNEHGIHGINMLTRTSKYLDMPLLYNLCNSYVTFLLRDELYNLNKNDVTNDVIVEKLCTFMVRN